MPEPVATEAASPVNGLSEIANALLAGILGLILFFALGFVIDALPWQLARVAGTSGPAWISAAIRVGSLEYWLFRSAGFLLSALLLAWAIHAFASPHRRRRYWIGLGGLTVLMLTPLGVHILQFLFVVYVAYQHGGR